MKNEANNSNNQNCRRRPSNRRPVVAVATIIILAIVPYLKRADAVQDPNYYGPNGNPNLAYSHYWVDAANVLEDLSSFQALYVMYHNCAWSTSYYNYNNNNNNNNHRFLKDDKNNQRQCGRGGEGGDNKWYMGMGECVGSNVAYSLFGILPGDGGFSGNRKSNPCVKRTFINSFYTTDGLLSFAAASNGAIDITYVNQACTSLGNGYSTTLGCSASGEFQVDDFYGYECNGLYYNSTLDTLDWLNQNLTEAMTCTPIYKNDGSVDYASQLLYYSVACNTEGNNKNFCPDPFGMLEAYEYNFAMAKQDGNYTVLLISPHDENKVVRICISVFFVVAGVFLLTMSAMEWWKHNGKYVLVCQWVSLDKLQQKVMTTKNNKADDPSSSSSHQYKEGLLLPADDGVFA